MSQDQNQRAGLIRAEDARWLAGGAKIALRLDRNSGGIAGNAPSPPIRPLALREVPHPLYIVEASVSSGGGSGGSGEPGQLVAGVAMMATGVVTEIGTGGSSSRLEFDYLDALGLTRVGEPALCWIQHLDPTVAIETGTRFACSAPAWQHDDLPVFVVGAVVRDHLWAELTGSAATGTTVGPGVDADRRAYSWVQRAEGPAGRWVNGPLAGTFNAYAVEPAAGFSGVVPAGTLVLLRKSPTVPGVYEFIPPFGAESGSSGSGGSGGVTSPGRLIGTKVSRVECEPPGLLRVYLRDQFQDADMRVTDGPERYGYLAGCCVCDGELGSGSGGSGSSGGGGGGLLALTGCCPGTSAAAVVVTFAGGNGTATLTSDGTNFVGTKTFACGPTIGFRYKPDTCTLEYRCTDGAGWVPAAPSIGDPDCGPPFVDSRTHTVNLNSGANGCSYPACGTINVVEVAAA